MTDDALAHDREILEARALELARENPPEEAPGESLEVIEFVLSQQRYALESSLAVEVFHLRELVTLPGSPDFLIGIAEARGAIVSVVDLHCLLGMARRGLGERDTAILLSDGEMEIAVLADEIAGVTSLGKGEVMPYEHTGSGLLPPACIRGVTGSGVVLLDAGEILGDPRLVIDQGE